MMLTTYSSTLISIIRSIDVSVCEYGINDFAIAVCNTQEGSGTEIKFFKIYFVVPPRQD